MSDKITDIVKEIEQLKSRLKEEINSAEEDIAYEIKRGKIFFSDEILINQKENITNFFQFFKDAPLLHILSAPIVYMMIIPAVILDIMLFVYVRVIFKIYKFPPIKRDEYIVFDRHYLGYLNFIEKLNCLYCSYFNGLINYTAAVASRSELYFCPIKHAKKIAYSHEYYYSFLPYADADSYQKNLKKCQKNAQIKD